MHKLHLAVIAALPGLALAQATNVALTGTASQSSTRPAGGAASRGIDGNTDGVWGNNSVTHTNPATLVANEWWQVVLKKPEAIHEIRIWSRSNCCTPSRLSNVKVTAFLGTATMFTTTNAAAVPKGNYIIIDLGGGIICDRVQDREPGYSPRHLQIAEVELLRYSQPIMNLARLGKASQSSLASGGVATRAIDGNYNRHWSRGSITHTSNPGTTASWWQVELAWPERIDELRFYNRGDCCGNRLSNFRVSVFVGAAEVWGKDYFVTTGQVAQGRVHIVSLPKGTVGDRVRIALKGMNRANNYVLSLAEVEVLRFGASLTPDTIEIKSTTGSKQKLVIDAGRGLARQTYLLIGSITGTSPGITFSGVNVPLNVDPYFLWTLENPALPPITNSLANLDAAGRSKAEFTIPAGVPSLIGVKAHHAYTVLGKTALLDAASNAVLLKIVK